MPRIFKGYQVKEKAIIRITRNADIDADALYDEDLDYRDFMEKNPGAKIYMATTKSPNLYTDVKYEPDCYIMFGKESAGIPEEILCHHKKDSIRIPMIGDIRSLNLGNSVAIVLYEALRQNGFAGMNTEGHLHRLEWDE